MTQQEVTTRMVAEGDLPIVLDMVHALSAHHGDTSTLTLAALKRDAGHWHKIIVACVGDQIVGYASLLPRGQLHTGERGMNLHHLFVSSECRRRGVGGALIKAATAISKELGCVFLAVETAPDNTRAQQVYLDAGFAPRPIGGPQFSIRLDE